MREIDNMSEFFGWAETAIRSSKTQVPIPIGIIRSYHDIFRLVEERGSFSLGSDANAWASHLTGLLESARQDSSRTELASALVNYFIGKFYAVTIEARGIATLTQLVAATRDTLNVDPEDLYLTDRGKLLRSSPAFDERFFRRVRVPIPPGFAHRGASRLGRSSGSIRR